ncbi:glycosyltransferase family 2 protein [Martelella alba]|uniref:Glycosyltransferase family 2 protein n=1 Tax=Martelella alba TaxID=2590451 RepID=A0ABY2SM24_9HYPH|nr:glycosyltransferase family A protein [Martelella alba]TKI04600.1 glycosyltransferase family 2 protein [Martelella alba]
MVKLSLIIPAYNEESYLAECLRHAIKDLSAHAAPGEYEIIVVNNASTDQTPTVAAGFAQVRLVYAPVKGLTHARQKGLESAAGDILAFIDADTRMPTGWVGKVLAAYEENAELVCVSGPYRYHDLPWLKRAMVKLYWWALAKPTYWFTGYMAVGGNFAASKRALLRIGGFDTSIAFYGEDTNIARRLAGEGKVRFDLDMVMETSARRLKEEGFTTTAVRYVINFLSEVLLKKPATSEYRDIR